MSASGALTTLQLYRAILSAARHFPSVKKHRIIAEIKSEFRRNRGLSQPDQVAHCRALAERGLSDLQGYAAAAGSTQDASITLKGATS